MKNKYIKNILSKIFLVLILISIALTFSIELLATKDSGFIEWRAIPGANGYTVEIKDESLKTILITNVNQNIYYVDLPKGKYEFRIGVLNFFKKPVVWSYWNQLRIIVSKQPILVDETIEASIGEKVILTGNYFLENTKVTLITDGNIKQIENVILNPTKLSFTTDNLQPGTYDVLLENPNNKKLTKKNYLVLNKRSNRKKEPDKIIKNKEITITSESLEKADILVYESTPGKTTVNIGHKTKDKLDITLENKSIEKIAVDVNNHSKGKVNFSVENKSKEKMDLNINNLSKEIFVVGIIDKSKGKVDVNVSEKSKDKVEINSIFADIENFDVTIENKSKEKFDINIGQPPIVFVPEKRKPEKSIDRKDISISSDSVLRADISIDESKPGKMSLDIGPNTKDDLDISMENKSKEDVSVDINNRAEGKINFNVENKSNEKLSLNINNNSKKEFSLGIHENSKGKVDVQVDEKSKSKVEINKINTNIEVYDITIENKTKENFDINIGKKELPPLVFIPSKEKIPKDYPNYSLKEYQNYLNGLKRTCSSNLDVPDIIIEECHPRHVKLSLADLDKKVLYNFIKLNSGNYISRISAYKFFIENCSPSLLFITELLDFRIKNITQDDNEKFFMKKVMESFNSCKNKDER